MNTETATTHEPDTAAIGEQYLTFVLAEEEYAVDILKVQEIKSWGPVTPVPCSPGYVLGVINLRGAIVPVVDLRLLFELPEADYTSTTAVVIVRSVVAGQLRVVGLVVDKVAEVYHLGADNIQPSTSISSNIGGQFFSGLGHIEEKLVILIDLDRLVAVGLDEIEALEEATQ